MRKICLALSLLLIPVSLATAAEQPRSGTAEEQAACARDVQKLCRPVMDQGDFTVLACLKENRPKISPACDAVLKAHNQ